MSTMHSDRNLLFGILALQMDFVSKDQLFAGMSAWVLQKEQPLGLILVEQGALLDEDRTLLDSVVRRHIAKHGDDPHQSLVSLGPAAEITTHALTEIADPDVQASLLTASSSGFERDDPFATRTYASPFLGGRYRVLRPLASGALGEVSVALDQELKREVALKQIKPRHADSPEHRGRFLLEAELTGHLEHPGTVPVYSLGEGDDGRPYYAMRLIRGETLGDAINAFYGSDASDADRTIAFRKLIRRFITVCETIDYAHSRKILHRDLKPSNIMVGRFGETLVVDWGLAKLVGRAEGESSNDAEVGLHTLSSSGTSSETLPGSAVGTPAYMSPEQAEGRVQAMTAASDVYSLGATLYVLITGRPPFDGKDLGSILKQVAAGSFPRPRAVAPSVSRPLESICVKAMSRNADDRYQSARELADDLERWLADEPVTADQEPAIERVGRWSRKHRPAVAAVAGLLLASVVLLSGATVFLRRAEARTLIQKQLAEQNFREARATILSFLKPLVEEKNDFALRPKLLGVARDRLTLFIKTHGNDPSLQTELAATHFQLGSVITQSVLMGTPLQDEPRFESSPEMAFVQKDAARAVPSPELNVPPAPAPPRAAVPAPVAVETERPLPPGPTPVVQQRSRPSYTEFEKSIAESLAHYEESLQLYTRLAKEFPNEPKYQERVRICMQNVASLKRMTTQSADSGPMVIGTGQNQAVEGGALTMFGD